MVETRPILVVEDSDEDFAALRWIWRRNEIQVPLVRCRDGDEALEWLLGTGRYQGAKTGTLSLVLLDLNLPRCNGYSLLAAMRNNPLLATKTVVVLTTSTNPKDVEACYRNGANGYVIKPIELEELEAVIHKLLRFWMEAARLP